ncbi:MAG: FlgD immunoglobulin-like domain containing protein [Candidatus Cloacimonadales bacterium]
MARLVLAADSPGSDDSFLLVTENQPSLGSNPFTVSSYGTFAGYVFDAEQNPVADVLLEPNFYPGPNREPITTDATGHFAAELPGKNYSFYIHLDYLASITDTTITIEPDSLNYYEFVFADYVSSADDQLENPATAYQLSNFPNPIYLPTTGRAAVTEFKILWDDTNSAAKAEIVIFNSKGQKVKTLSLAASNQASLTWDGRDRAGDICPAGVYFSKLIVEKQEVANSKMLLLK